MRYYIMIAMIALMCATEVLAHSDGGDWIVRYDGTGRGQHCHGSAVDSAGNLALTGDSWRDENSKCDIATVVFDKDARRRWLDIYKGIAEFLPNKEVSRLHGWLHTQSPMVVGNEHFWFYDCGQVVASDEQGGFYVLGSSKAIKSRSDWPSALVLARYGPKGNRIWIKRYLRGGKYSLGASWDYFVLAVDNQGNAYVAAPFLPNKYLGLGYEGYGRNTKVYVPGRLVLLKYDTNGKLMWEIDELLDFMPRSAVIDIEGSFCLAGATPCADECLIIRHPSTQKSSLVRAFYNPQGKRIRTVRSDERIGIFRGVMVLDKSGSLYAREIDGQGRQYIKKFLKSGELTWSFEWPVIYDFAMITYQGRDGTPHKTRSGECFGSVLDKPIGIDENGSVYMANSMQDACIALDSSGRQISEYPIPKSALASVQNILVGPAGAVYIVREDYTAIKLPPIAQWPKAGVNSGSNAATGRT